MKYVVTIIDLDGKVYAGDVPTSKSHAQRWANQYIADGLKAGILPVQEEAKE